MTARRKLVSKPSVIPIRARNQRTNDLILKLYFH